MTEKVPPIRWGWLTAMYAYTLVGAGGFGLAMLAFPAAVRSAFGFPAQDPIVFKLSSAQGMTAP